jgi:phospholipase C
MAEDQLPLVQHMVQLMPQNRSFDHMLGFRYPER